MNIKKFALLLYNTYPFLENCVCEYINKYPYESEMNMIYLTGDTHRDFTRIDNFCRKYNPTKDDTFIILGDAGINYHGESLDARWKHKLNELPLTLFCIHGNHEIRPESISNYEEIEWNGGFVYNEIKYPFLLFAKDGEVYNLDGKQYIVIGGAYSVDKYFRLRNGHGWWEDEQPSYEIKQRTEKKLDDINWKIDVVLSHTCPYKYIPREAFIEGIDQSSVDNSTEEWLDFIENQLSYKKWYCAHFHIEKSIDKMRFLYKEL